MKCPDCNGVIEGRRPFCPHCGRKMGGGLFSMASPPSPVSPRPPVIGADRAEAARKVREIQARWIAHASLIRVAAFAVIGATIGSFLPGLSWIGGAMMGLFLGLPGKKKKS